jgi:hypothetical protein
MPHARKIDVPLSDRLGYSVAETSGLLGIAISTLYNLIASDRLKTEKVAGRRIVPRWAIEALLGRPIEVLLANKPPAAGDGLSAVAAGPRDLVRPTAPKSRRGSRKAIAGQVS